MGPEHFWWGGFGLLHIITIIALIIIIFAVIRCLFWRRAVRPPWMGSCDAHPFDRADSENAIDILKKRYAKGEINKEEFEQIKKDLMS